MRLLALDAALGPALAAILDRDTVIAEATANDAKTLALLVAGLPLDEIEMVAVTVGPGSFTGLRAALSLAQGFATARGLPLVPVTVAEAFVEALPHLGGRTLWVAVDSRRKKMFLDQGAGMRSVGLLDVTRPDRPVALAGNAARELAAVLAARGADVMLTDERRVRARDVARAALRRRAGELPPLDAVPLYVDPPAARPPGR